MRISDWSSDVCSSDLILMNSSRVMPASTTQMHMIDFSVWRTVSILARRFCVISSTIFGESFRVMMCEATASRLACVFGCDEPSFSSESHALPYSACISANFSARLDEHKSDLHSLLTISVV